MPKYLLAFAVLLAVATPAWAADYYVVKDPTTGRCTISKDKPDGTKLVMVGTQAYASKDDAKEARKERSADCSRTEKKTSD